MSNARTEEAQRFLTATKKARRHINFGMRNLLEALHKAILHEGPIPKELKDQTKDQDFWWYYIDGDPTKDLERVADAILSWDSDIEIGFRSGANYEHI